MSAGSTARSDFSTDGELPSAGKSFKASAPAKMAPKASVGVAKPGTHVRSRVLARRMTVSSACGITMKRPPASSTASTWSGRKTVPAPISAVSPKARASLSMLANGAGELRGTSIISMPASSNVAPIGSASSAVMPRRMAIRRVRCRRILNDVTYTPFDKFAIICSPRAVATSADITSASNLKYDKARLYSAQSVGSPTITIGGSSGELISS